MPIPIYYSFYEFEKYYLMEFHLYLKKCKVVNMETEDILTLYDYYCYLSKIYVEKINLLIPLGSDYKISEIQKILIENFNETKIKTFSVYEDFGRIEIADLKENIYLFVIKLERNLSKIADFIQNKVFEIDFLENTPLKGVSQLNTEIQEKTKTPFTTPEKIALLEITELEKTIDNLTGNIAEQKYRLLSVLFGVSFDTVKKCYIERSVKQVHRNRANSFYNNNFIEK